MHDFTCTDTVDMYYMTSADKMRLFIESKKEILEKCFYYNQKMRGVWTNRAMKKDKKAVIYGLLRHFEKYSTPIKNIKETNSFLLREVIG